MSRTIEVAGSGKLRVPPRNFRERAEKLQERSQLSLPFDDWANYFNYGGLSYPFGLKQTLGGKEEEIPADFAGLVQGAYRENGVVFACMMARRLLFSEARFQFRRLRNNQPTDELFGNRDLAILEKPWPGAKTGKLLSRMITDVDLAGSSFITRRGNNLRRLRPDWVTIVLGSEDDPEVEAGDIDAEILGYIYHPGGMGGGRDPEVLLREQVAMFTDAEDPLASYRGMSWLTPVIREIMGDKAMTSHKLQFFENGATPNLVVSLDPAVKLDDYTKWVEAFTAKSEGLANAYKTLYLGGGADATVVGANLRQLDFKMTQGAAETRIAVAARIPPVIVGLSEGLEAATYSNYGQARRAFADLTMRPLWRDGCAALETIIPTPADAELWYSERHISFLQEDRKDDSNIQYRQAQTIRTLIDGGYTPDSIVDAVRSGDWSRLVHSKLYSVQLQPPGTVTTNGNGASPAASALVGEE